MSSEPLSGEIPERASREPDAAWAVRPSWVWGVAALGLFVAVTALYLHPWGHRFSDSLLSDLGDPLFNLVVLKWVMHAASHGFQGLWSPPFFYPTHGVLAFSDHLVGPALLGLLLRPLLPTSMALYNLLVLGSFVLSGVFTAWVVRRSGGSRPAALAAGLVFAFSPFRWDQLPHFAILRAQWIPLVLWSFDRLLERPGWRRAATFLACYALHVSGGTYLAYMIHIPLAILVVNRLRRDGHQWLASRKRGVLLVTVGLCAILLLAIFVPYATIQSSLGVHRSARVIGAFGATFGSYLTVAELNHYPSLFGQARRPENCLFPGFAATFLALFGLLALLRSVEPPAAKPLRHWQRAVLWVLAASALVGLLISDATVLKQPILGGLIRPQPDFGLAKRLTLIGWFAALGLRRWWQGTPLRKWSSFDPWQRGLLAIGATTLLLTFPPFFLAARSLLPGLGGMRVPARFYVFTSLVAAFLAAHGLDALRGKLASRRARALLVTLALSALLLESWPQTIHWSPLRREADFPAYAQWLGRSPQVQAYLELPFPPRDADEALRMYYESAHWKPMVNGYSGYLSPTYISLRSSLQWPNLTRGQIVGLVHLGVTHLVLRVGRQPERRAGVRNFEHRLVKRAHLATLVYSDARTRIYRLHLPAEGRPEASTRRQRAAADH